MTRHRMGDDAWVAIISVLVYLSVGIWLNNQDLIFPDALSRVANGYYVFFSRDPHLAAIGFVWNPLPSLLVIPVLGLAPFFPVLVSKAFAGVIVSVLAGAFVAVLMRRTMVEFGLSRGWALGLTLLFAIQPLVLISASVGASESLLLASALYVTLQLTRWLRQDDPWHLLQAGLGLGVGYLVRYEAAPAALVVSLVVAGVSLWRYRGGQRARGLALLNWCLVSAPFGAAFVGWAAVSKVIVGQWFATYASQYGNSAQVRSGRTTIDSVTGGDFTGIVTYLGTQLTMVAPLAIPLAVITLVVALVRRDLPVLGPAAVLGTILAFEWLVFLNGTSFGWLRFQIMAIPWAYLSAAYLIAVTGTRIVARTINAVVLLAAFTVTLPWAWQASLDSHLAREEALAMSAAREGQYRAQRAAAAYLDDLDLPDGSVLTDVAYNFPIVLASKNPKQFAITPDRDFLEKVANPAKQGVRYALLARPDLSQADAINKRFPGIYQDGAGVATLAMEWRDAGGTTWRLYEFT